MKAILEFDLTNEEDISDYKRANSAIGLARALYQMQDYLRSEYKYPPDTQTQLESATVERIRDKFFEILNINNINLDELCN